MNTAAQGIMAQLGLQPLPGEGGFFRQTWLSAETGPDGRPLGSAIQYLITPEGFSALHLLRTDEVWHFYAGDPVEHVQLDPLTHTARTTRLGSAIAAGEQVQLVVARDIWQGARLAEGGRHGWALLGCTLAPAWDEREWETGKREDLLACYPAAASLIQVLTR
jgi:predicted cupin superfamily sugar epimerase